MDLESFTFSGVLALRGFVARDLTASAKDMITAELKRLKILVNGKYSASKIQALPVFQQTGRLGQMVKGGPEIDRLITPELLQAIGKLAGAKVAPAHSHPQILLSLPHKEEWSLHGLNWHLDLAVPKENRLPGVQAFVLVDDVKPGGGATLALAGSHRLHYLRAGVNAHGILKEHREFQKAPEKFLQPQDIGGVPVQIVEMSGRAGDVFLMDLRVLHSPSVNAGKSVRMMVTNRFLHR